MLAPNNNRLDYGELLRAPENYDFDAAVATSYSVSLDTLLAVPIALCFGNTLEGDLRGEKLALLEAVRRLNKRLKVFYQEGKIAKPSSFNSLFNFLESCLHPVTPSKKFSAFHPKLWLLRYKSEDKNIRPEIKYRLIILSRNLTMDNSWDIAVSLEGNIEESHNKKAIGSNWLAWVTTLLKEANDFEPGHDLCRELPYVCWEPPFGFNRMPEVLVGDCKHSPLDLAASNQQLLVVSPFLSREAIVYLQRFAPRGGRYLFSRAEELKAFTAEELSGWSCFVMNEKMVDTDTSYLETNDAPEIGKPYNLHAKLIVSRKRSRVSWYIGSANATNAALGNNRKQPRNTEVMLKLSGSKNNSNIGPDTLIEQWVGDDEGGLFVKYQPRLEAAEVQHPATNKMREVVFELIKSNFQQKATLRTDEDKYNLNLTCDCPYLNRDTNVDIQVSQLAFGKPKRLRKKVLWSDVAITEISAFLPISITIKISGEDNLVKTLLVKTTLNIEGGDTRQQVTLKKLIDGKDKILNYISLLLQTKPDKSQWVKFDQEKGSGGDIVESFFGYNTIYEQLLWAAAYHPVLLKRLQILINDLKQAESPLPDDFETIWVHFEKEMHKK